MTSMRTDSRAPSQRLGGPPRMSYGAGTSYSPADLSNMVMPRGNQDRTPTRDYYGQNVTIPNLSYADNLHEIVPTVWEHNVLMKNDFLLRICPLRRSDKMTFEWNRYEFSPMILGIYPERTSARIMSARRITGYASLSRRGGAIYYTVAFLQTETGRQFLVNQLAQLVESSSMTLQLDVMQRILATKPYILEEEAKKGVYNESFIGEKIADEIAHWDFVKKVTTNPLVHLEQRVKERMRRYNGTFDNMILDERALSFLALDVKQLQDYSYAGPDGPTLRKSGKNSYGLVKGASSVTYNFVSDFDTGILEEHFNVLEASRQIGGYSVALDLLDGRYENYENYSGDTNRSIQIYSESQDKMVTLTLRDLWAAQTRCQLNNNDGYFSGLDDPMFNLIDNMTTSERDDEMRKDPYHYFNETENTFKVARFLGHMRPADPSTNDMGDMPAAKYIDMAHSTITRFSRFYNAHAKNIPKGSSAHLTTGWSNVENVLNTIKGVRLDTPESLKAAVGFFSAANECMLIRGGKPQASNPLPMNLASKVTSVLEVPRNQFGWIDIPVIKGLENYLGSALPSGAGTEEARKKIVTPINEWIASYKGKFELPPFYSTFPGLKTIQKAYKSLPNGETVEDYYGFNTESFKQASEACSLVEFVATKLYEMDTGCYFIEPFTVPAWYTKPDPATALLANLMDCGQPPTFYVTSEENLEKGIFRKSARSFGGKDKEEEDSQLKSWVGANMQGVMNDFVSLLKGIFDFSNKDTLKSLETVTQVVLDGSAAATLPEDLRDAKDKTKVMAPLHDSCVGILDFLKRVNLFKENDDLSVAIDEYTKLSLLSYVLRTVAVELRASKPQTRTVAVLSGMQELLSKYYEPGQGNAFEFKAFKNFDAYIRDANTFLQGILGTPKLNVCMKELKTFIAFNKKEKAALQEDEEKDGEKLFKKKKDLTEDDDRKRVLRTPLTYTHLQYGDLCDYFASAKTEEVKKVTLMPSSPKNPDIPTTAEEMALWGPFVFKRDIYQQAGGYPKSNDLTQMPPVLFMGESIGSVKMGSAYYNSSHYQRRGAGSERGDAPFNRRSSSSASIGARRVFGRGGDESTDDSGEEGDGYERTGEDRDSKYGVMRRSEHRELPKAPYIRPESKVLDEPSGVSAIGERHSLSFYGSKASLNRKRFFERNAGESSFSDQQPDDHYGYEKGDSPYSPLKRTRFGSDSDFASVITKNFESAFASVAREAPSGLVRVVAQVYISMPLRWRSLNALIVNNIAFPFNFLVLRPHERYKTTDVIFIEGDGRTMTTVYNRPTWMEGTDAKTQTVAGSLFFNAACIVHRPENLFVMPNVFVVKYEGGCDVVPFERNTYDPARDSYGGKNASMFVAIVPCTFKDQAKTPNGCIDIAGRDLTKSHTANARGFTTNYPGARWMAMHWNFGNKGLNSPIDRPDNLYVNGIVTPNSQCYPELTYYWNPEQKSFSAYRPAKGHWGTDQTYTGCAAARSGRMEFHQKNLSVVNYMIV